MNSTFKDFSFIWMSNESDGTLNPCIVRGKLERKCKENKTDKKQKGRKREEK